MLNEHGLLADQRNGGEGRRRPTLYFNYPVQRYGAADLGILEKHWQR
jgi:hypothetical protein